MFTLRGRTSGEVDTALADTLPLILHYLERTVTLKSSNLRLFSLRLLQTQPQDTSRYHPSLHSSCPSPISKRSSPSMSPCASIVETLPSSSTPLSPACISSMLLYLPWISRDPLVSSHVLPLCSPLSLSLWLKEKSKGIFLLISFLAGN